MGDHAVLNLMLQAAAAAGPMFVNTPSVIVSADVTAAAPLAPGAQASLRVWRLEPGGWASIEAENLSAGVARVTTAGDGEYALFVALNTPAHPPHAPTLADAPHAVFIVDTRAPTLQIHRVKAENTGAAPAQPTLRLELTLLEENLDSQGVTLFWRPSGLGPWMDGGKLTLQGASALWSAHTGAPRRVDLMVVAVDQAGNRATDTWMAASLRSDVEQSTHVDPSPPPSSLPQTAAATPAQQRFTAPRPSATAPAPADRDPRVERLRKLAREHASRGQISLAAARLEDALSIDPAEPDLLAELGGAALRMGQSDGAASRFSAALACDPRHTASIEGLALVAVAQNRYDAARSRLLELLALQPQSGEAWLRYGDVEHKLGNLDDARQAWQNAAENASQRPLRDKADQRLRLFSAQAGAR